MKNKDKMGNELDEFGFRKDFDWDNRFDLKTEVDDYLISTVDLGVDHSFGYGKPLYYETMIFTKKGKDIDLCELYCKRYSTEEEAKMGHNLVVDLVKKGKLPILEGDENEIN